MAFDRDQMTKKAAMLAARGVYIVTSSWKREVWRGMLDDESSYLSREKYFKDLITQSTQ